jgi:hypothetical protein
MFLRKLASLSFALALVYSVSLPAHAELLKNFKVDGSIETRSFSADNLTDRNSATDDHRGETTFRLMTGGTFDLLDDVHAKLLIDKTGQQGGTTGQDLNTVQSSILVDNAYAKIDKVFGHVDLTIGRQFYGDPNDINIYFGPNDDQLLTVNSVDLFRADADIMGWAKFQGIAGQTVTSSLTGTNPATDVWGGEINTDRVIPKGNLAAYYYTRMAHTTKVAPATGNNTLDITGIRANGDFPLLTGLGYHAEMLQDLGRNNAVAAQPAYDGSAYFLGVNYGHDFAAGYPIRARLEYGRGSDNFAAVSPGRRFGIIWGRFSDIAGDPATLNRGANGTATGLSNLKVVDAGLGTTCPKTKIGLDLNWYRFQYDGNIAGAGTSAGTEWDLILSYKHSENVSFEVNAATLQIGSALQNAAPTGTSPVTELGADVKIKF